jgi:hypothetical protein
MEDSKWPSAGLAALCGQANANYSCICELCWYFSIAIADSDRRRRPDSSFGRSTRCRDHRAQSNNAQSADLLYLWTPRKFCMKPSILVLTILVQAVTAFVFCVPNIQDSLDHPTGYPFLYALQLSVPNGVIVCVLLILIALIGASNIGFAAATARITYVFARDQGLPFSQWISKVCDWRE